MKDLHITLQKSVHRNVSCTDTCTCTSLIIEQPLLSELLPKHQLKVLTKLSTDIPLKVTAPLISDEQYWERCCRARWQLCDISDYDHNWKRMFFERNAQEAVETFVPDQSDIMQVCAYKCVCVCVCMPYCYAVLVGGFIEPNKD